MDLPSLFTLSIRGHSMTTDRFKIADQAPREPDMMVPVEAIHYSHSDRARKDISYVKSLAESISEHGLINPVTLSKREDGDGRLFLIAGGQRFLAMATLGWTEVPAFIKTGLTHLEEKEIELEENLRRKDLSPVEECENLAQIEDIKKKVAEEAGKPFTRAQIENITGKSKQHISTQITFARQMRDRKDIKEKVQHLPLKVAMKETSRILESERMDRLAEKGLISQTSELIKGDAIELIRDLADGSIDLILTDPPFGLTKITEMEGVTAKDQLVQSFSSTLSPDDNLDLDRARLIVGQVLQQFNRVLKEGSHFYIFCALPILPYWTKTLESQSLHVEPAIIWNKGVPTVPSRGSNYMSCYETILYGWKGEPRRLAKPSKNILEFPPIRSGLKVHPFEKPQGILTFLIGQSTNSGETVLDPFAGSGATILAAKGLGRKPLGFEINERSYNLAISRLKENEE